MQDYTVILNHATFRRLEIYRKAIGSGSVKPGERFQHRLAEVDLGALSIENFLELLMNTKQPQIFAERAVHGDGRDWSLIELQLLGDVSLGMGVTIFDDGRHQSPLVHEVPFEGFLIYTPGALLRNDQGESPADWMEVHHKDGTFDLPAYIALYRRRLGPVLQWVETMASSRKRPAIVTIPGMGCGQFAGPYMGGMAEKLELALADILERIADSLPSINAVWYDPYNDCEMASRTFGHLKMLTRPLLKDLSPKPQLSEPQILGFENCDLYSVVAWDHVSWPGNDYYVGSRATDDGVKAAATDTMRKVTGVAGRYDKRQAKYLPPEEYGNWNDVVSRNNLRLKAVDRIFVA